MTYRASKEVLVAVSQHWTERHLPEAGAHRPPFEQRMRDLSSALIRIHLPRMGQEDAERAALTLTCLETGEPYDRAWSGQRSAREVTR